jgi:uncharacterized protein (TIGR03437 family)
MQWLLIATLALSTLVPNPDGLTVYDSANKINWLADANLAATNRFGLPVCTPANTDTKTCINPSGSMTYQAAAAWVAAMNAANYLGHTNWQLPTTPFADASCPLTGPAGILFGFTCTGSALGSLFYNGLGLSAPNTAVPIPNNTINAFTNFQPYLYWSQTPDQNTGSGYYTFSFATGFQGSNSIPNYLYVLPMLPGKVTAPQTFYDSTSNVTWSADANLAATNTFGIAPCKTQTNPKPCVSADGAMDWNSAAQFIANMNTAAYLGQINWQLPTVSPACANYNCTAGNPMGELYYSQFGLTQGQPIVPTPKVSVGPFKNIQPYLYWACQSAATIPSTCSTTQPAPGFEWSFSFGNGFEGTDILQNDLYVTAYFPGSPTTTTGPEISLVANAESESPNIAPNTWLEIKGVSLAPANDSRIWQTADFANDKMPTALDNVSATVNGKSAYIYFISPTQLDILSPPDPITGPVLVTVTNNGITTPVFTAQAQPTSPSFFVFNGGPYVAATHANGTYISSNSPAKPGETIVLYANGFGPTTVPITNGSVTQSGTLSPLPTIQIGGVAATVIYAGLAGFPGEFQFNVVVPASLANADQPISATYNGNPTQAGVFITIHN